MEPGNSFTLDDMMAMMGQHPSGAPGGPTGTGAPTPTGPPKGQMVYPTTGLGRVPMPANRGFQALPQHPQAGMLQRLYQLLSGQTNPERQVQLGAY